MLTFAAAVVGVAATVGCGSAANGRAPEPRPILTAPPRATMTVTVTAATPPRLEGLAKASMDSDGLASVEESTKRSESQSPLPPVPTAMVAAAIEPSSPPIASSSRPPLSQAAGVEQWRPLVESIFPAFAVETALRIMACESGGRADATGSAGERGLFQIHGIHYDSTYDPTGNVLAAFRISAGGTNWNPWTCR